MDVTIPYGVIPKKCKKVSLNEFHKNHLFALLEKSLDEKDIETSFSLIAELHSSDYFKDIHNFIINYYSRLCLSKITYPYFINLFLEKIKVIMKEIKPKYRDLALVNSNELRNIYAEVFSTYLEMKKVEFPKFSKKDFVTEKMIKYTNLNEYQGIYDKNNVEVSDKIKIAVREIFYYLDLEGNVLNKKNVENILYWINFYKNYYLRERKINKGFNYHFLSTHKNLKPYEKFSGTIEFFIWNKICHKTKNRKLTKSYLNLFFYQYNKQLLLKRAHLLAVSVLLCNLNQLKLDKTLSENNLISIMKINQFYLNISKDENNDEKYLEIFNEYHNKQPKIKITSTDAKLEYLQNFIPTKKIDKVSDYFSN